MKTKKRKSIRENPNQIKIRWEWLPPINSSWMLRSCPCDASHRVQGTCFSQGGRTWYCLECGIEWSASIRTGFIQYYSITPKGGRKLLKKRALRYYPEVESIVKRLKENAAV